MIKGEPEVQTRNRFIPPESGGIHEWDTMTAMPAVNAAQHVAAAPGGIITLQDVGLASAPAGVWHEPGRLPIRYEHNRDASPPMKGSRRLRASFPRACHGTADGDGVRRRDIDACRPSSYVEIKAPHWLMSWTVWCSSSSMVTPAASHMFILSRTYPRSPMIA